MVDFETAPKQMEMLPFQIMDMPDTEVEMSALLQRAGYQPKPLMGWRIQHSVG